MWGISTGSLLIGSLVTTILIIGVPANLLAMTYFATRRLKNVNSKFFRRIYVLITVVDIFICLCLVPVLEAALTPNKEGLMFNNDVFCQIWGILWVIFPNMSVFLISMLSIARLIVLKTSTTKLKVRTACLIPLIFLLSLSAVIFIMLQARITVMTFRPQYFTCGPMGATRQGDVGSSGALTRAILGLVLYTLIPGLAIIPITVSFVFSIVYLNRARRFSQGLGRCTKRHYEATKTVIIVTLVYIVCNLPFSFSALVMILKMFNILSEMNAEKTSLAWRQEFFEQNPALNYAVVVVFVICIAGNSVVNPFVYVFRMANFRMYIRHLIGDRKASVTRSL